MELDVLLHFCACQYQLYEIPLRVYRGGKLIAKMDRSRLGKYDEEREATVLRDISVFRDKTVHFAIHASLLLEGAVFEKSSDLFVYVGLARGVHITLPIARRYLADMGASALTEEDIGRFQAYMNQMPVVAPGLFVVVLSALNTFLNGEVIPPGEIFARNVVGQVDTGVRIQMLAQREARYFGGRENNANFIGTEERFLFFVRNGMVEELQAFCRECQGFEMMGNAENPDAWRAVKDKCIVGIALVSRASIRAGLSPLEAVQLCDLYVQRAELCRTAEALNEVRYSMLIDFTERVRELNFSRTDNQLVNRVCRYILEHLEEPLTLQELAGRFGVNKNHLCGVFKAEIGKGITEYIQYHKINAAKQMLRYTDKSLIEIANYLSFCTQSYFQKVFKKVTGVTPAAYRNASENGE